MNTVKTAIMMIAKMQESSQSGKPRNNCMARDWGKYQGMENENNTPYTNHIQLGKTFSMCIVWVLGVGIIGCWDFFKERN